MRYLAGIDFSGDHAKWSAGCAKTNVWVATGVANGSAVVVESLIPVQQLCRPGHPFTALSDFLNGLGDGYVGIDAPFCVPAALSPDGVRAAWQKVASLAFAERPFPRGRQLVHAFDPQLPERGAKLHRETEKYWMRKGVNVRSTMWAGPRGGAPFAAACMTLLARHRGPVWPMIDGPGATLVEAFPAAQLRHWELPFVQYNGSTAVAQGNRASILLGLEAQGLVIDQRMRSECERSADALDALVCMFAGFAVADGMIAVDPGEAAKREGHIAVRS
ncbi:MAG: DUF429 domain-containing protein [Roseiarcus sp.]|jgi:hypothetical protein